MLAKKLINADLECEKSSETVSTVCMIKVVLNSSLNFELVGSKGRVSSKVLLMPTWIIFSAICRADPADIIRAAKNR